MNMKKEKIKQQIYNYTVIKGVLDKQKYCCI